MTSTKNEYLHAIVDMGSNGIRFSITSLAPPTTRILPTLFLDRAGISLYDAQYDASGTKQPIPLAIISAICVALKRFKRTCGDFGVPEANIRVLATEATRVALNSDEYRAAIRREVGWEVELLPKDQEGQVGAMGIASSFTHVQGLVMDLGGGSTQMSWLSNVNGSVSVNGTGAVSLPYGAAAILRRLREAQKSGTHAVDALAGELQKAFRTSFEQVTKGASIGKDTFSLYLSGGGFRGYGSVLMDAHAISPYPIPIINGFGVPAATFGNAGAVALHVNDSQDGGDDIFRVSDRRASQIPAVTFLITCLTAALPEIGNVRFCQGGVREGALFLALSTDTRAEVPLTVATTPFSHSPVAATNALKLLTAFLPPLNVGNPALNPPELTTTILPALANSLNYYSGLAKDVRTVTALRSTTSGDLAGAHGLLHEERAALAIALCERHGGAGDLPRGDKEFYDRLVRLLSPAQAWWAIFVGRVAAIVGDVWPAQVGVGRVEIASNWGWGSGDDKNDPEDLKEKKDQNGQNGEKKDKKDKNTNGDFKIDGDNNSGKDKETLRIVLSLTDDTVVDDETKDLEKLGKKKNWVGATSPYGVKISVSTKALL